MTEIQWYIARASGLVGWGLLTASVIWGLLLSTKARVGGHRPRPNWMLDLHRYLGGLATVFTGVHVVAVLTDSYLHFSLASALIPFAGSWHPVAMAWGVVGLYLLAAVEISSFLRRRLSKRAWRAVHFTSFPLFISATAHAITVGTDAGTWLFDLAATASILAVGGLTAYRIHQAGQAPAPRRAVAA